MDHLRLVKFNSEWAVCQIMFVDEPRGEYDLPDAPMPQFEAWVYGKAKTVLCRVGQHECVYPLPTVEPTNFFHDRFPFAIDVKSDHSDYTDKIGGCTNAIAARAAFDVYVHSECPSTTITLRHGARIIAQTKGLGDFREWLTSQREAG